MIRRTRTAITIAALLAVAAGLAGCSSDAPSASRSDATTTSTGGATSTTRVRTTTAGPQPESFRGPAEAFYEVPDPLPAGTPGQLIRTMPVGAPDGSSGMRVMYHSTDEKGTDRAVTGLLYVPDGAAPAGGWPVVAWAHGTTGLAAPCAPSHHPAPPPDYGVKAVQVATDYIGLGPVGELHPYLNAAAEGHAVIDEVVAARSMPDVHAGDEWLVAGVSQGGHAALVTGEMASARLPDAKLLGTVALAPGAELGETYGDQLQLRVITTMVLAGVAAEDPDVHLADYLNPAALVSSAVIQQGCVQDISAAMAGPAADPGYFTTDPRTAPVGQAWLKVNDPGHVASKAPILLVQGEQDSLVLPARTAALHRRLCGLGQVVEQVDVPGADHDTVVAKSVDQVSRWVQARFAGQPVATDC
ncbi:lipase family protein [Aquihabitans sp. McL0605]|uniref:lipase family protein n=1 Tax=Aquihabitans sp. McL0605 TaxID=3415671 RepID=UPI003CF8F4CB